MKRSLLIHDSKMIKKLKIKDDEDLDREADRLIVNDSPDEKQIFKKVKKKLKIEEDENPEREADPQFIGDFAEEKMKKKLKIEEDEDLEREADHVEERETEFSLLDENLIYEVLKHADAKTLATSACVNKQWHATAQDERLWELICTRHWANIGCGNQQLRSVVLALGGFRRLHSLYLRPLTKPTVSASAWPAIAAPKPGKKWGKDEVQLSLSLLSIRYYEKMNLSRR